MIAQWLGMGRAPEPRLPRNLEPRPSSAARDSPRSALKGLIKRARDRAEPSYIFVNNRLEGNAPQTIEAIID
jgi:hypothetical protein